MAHLFFPLLLSTRLIERARLAITGVVFDRLDHNLEGALNLPQAFDGVARVTAARGVQGQASFTSATQPDLSLPRQRSGGENPILRILETILDASSEWSVIEDLQSLCCDKFSIMSIHGRSEC